MSDIIQKQPDSVLTPVNKERNANLELLRIFATLFVVILHYNNPSDAGGKAFLYTEPMPLHYQILLVFEMLTICAVDIFVMISGYFLCTSRNVKISKIIQLYIDLIVISILKYTMSCVLGREIFTLRDFLYRCIPLSWYVAVYSGLYLIFPFLNQILQNKSRTQFQFMLAVLFLVLSVWPSAVELLAKPLDISLNSLNPISQKGSGDGYTLINFILLYFLGAYCRLHGSQSISSRNRLYAIVVYFGCAIVNTLYAKVFFGRATSYCNPLVIVQTVSIFVFFQNLEIRSKRINMVAKHAFGVYLMHQFFFPYCRIERFVTGNPLLIPIHIIASALLIYMFSTLIFGSYHKLFNPVFEWIQRKTRFLNYDANGFLGES